MIDIMEKMEMVNPDALSADGFEGCELGVAYRACNQPVLAYDREKCIEILMTRDGMDREGAVEFFEFNTLGAVVENGPVFLTRYAIR